MQGLSWADVHTPPDSKTANTQAEMHTLHQTKLHLKGFIISTKLEDSFLLLRYDSISIMVSDTDRHYCKESYHRECYCQIEYNQI